MERLSLSESRSPGVVYGDLEDSLHLFNIFPEELWHDVLWNVQTPSEYHRISSASSVLAKLLQQQYWRIFSAKILPFVTSYCGHYSSEEGLHHLLSLRRVSRLWKEEADKILDNLPDNFLFSEEFGNRGKFLDDPRPHFRRRVTHTTFSSPDDLTSFCADFVDKGQNPFVGRKLSLLLPLHLKNVKKYFHFLWQMLDKFGHHIWYCNVETIVAHSVADYNLFDNCICLREILLRMPALRKLRFLIQIDNTNVVLRQHEAIEGLWTERQSMPTLPKLQMIDESGLPRSVLLSLLRANPQVTIIKTRDNWCDGIPANLEKLGIAVKNMEQILCFEQTNFVWPLTKLSVTIEKWNRNAQLGTVLEMVGQKFSDTLRELQVNMQPAYFPETFLNPVENLENLRKFHVCMTNFIPLDYLLPISNSLEEIWVEAHHDRTLLGEVQLLAPENWVHLFEHLEEPQGSNIWTLFPNLRVLRCLKANAAQELNEENWPKWETCTKQQWENEQQQQ